MESNKFEELEEIEQAEKVVVEKPELKEYQKLLIAERNRQLVEKANSLIGFGCFDQKEETFVDFSKLEKISDEKLKGKYTLYQNTETFDLIYICPLIENNAGDEENERKSMKPYGYDCIYVDTMDEETYEMVIKAGKNNLSTLVSFLYKASFISYIVLLCLAVFQMIYQMVAAGQQGQNFFTVIYAGIGGSAILLGAAVVALPLLVLMNIKYKKYMEK